MRAEGDLLISRIYFFKRCAVLFIGTNDYRSEILFAQL